MCRSSFFKGCFFTLALFPGIFAASQFSQYDITQVSNKTQALAFLNEVDGLLTSRYWVNVNPALFIKNMRHNLEHPEGLYQGKRTNFCGYSALTYLLIKYDPLGYVTHMTDLYAHGETRFRKMYLKPTLDVRNEAGVMMSRRNLDSQHADQMWFLTLADQYKAYLNSWDDRFQPGKENTIWAAVTYYKFNQMVVDILGVHTPKTHISLIRGNHPDMIPKLFTALEESEVVLFVDKNFKRSQWKRYFLPSHFLVLKSLAPLNADSLEMHYWDYGSVKKHVIRKKVLMSSVRGITTIHSGKLTNPSSIQVAADSAMGFQAIIEQKK